MIRVPEPVVHLRQPYTKAQWRGDIFQWKPTWRRVIKAYAKVWRNEYNREHPFLAWHRARQSGKSETGLIMQREWRTREELSVEYGAGLDVKK